MEFVLAVVAFLAVLGLREWRSEAALATERARVNELLRLLEAKAAPAEAAAYVFQPHEEPDFSDRLWSEDGLVYVEAGE